jgi:hypothetical protein
VLARPKALQLFVKHGDDVAEALVKHPGIAEDAVEKFGIPAAKAMATVGPRNGRRIAMMAADGGDLIKIGRSDELLGVVGKFGNRAVDFIWKHKVELAAGATLIAFLENPEPYLSGARDLTKVVAENTVGPVAQGLGKGVEKGVEKAVEAAAPEVGRQTNWTAVFLAGAGCVASDRAEVHAASGVGEAEGQGGPVFVNR